MKEWMNLLERKAKNWIVAAETLCFVLCANPCFAAYTRRHGQSAGDAILSAAAGGAGLAVIVAVVKAVYNWWNKK